jgi:hypothetical protein
MQEELSQSDTVVKDQNTKWERCCLVGACLGAASFLVFMVSASKTSDHNYPGLCVVVISPAGAAICVSTIGMWRAIRGKGGSSIVLACLGIVLALMAIAMVVLMPLAAGMMPVPS